MPTVNDLHIDQYLTDISIRYKNATYIATTAFPPVYVDKQSDKFPIYTKADWFRDEARIRAPGEIVVTSDYNVSGTTGYFAENYAAGKLIPDEHRRNADSVFDLDRDAAEWVTDRVQLKLERLAIAAYWGCAKWATTACPTYWDNYADSDPITNVETGKDTVLGATGTPANTLILGYQAFRYLRQHPDIVDRIKYTQVGVVTEALLATLFGVERVLVGQNIYTATAEGEAAPTYAYNWGDDAWVGYVAPRPSKLVPSAGYCMIWRMPEAGGAPYFVKRFRIDERGADKIEGHVYAHFKITACDAGYFMHNVVT